MKGEPAQTHSSRLSAQEIAPIIPYSAKATWPAGFQIYQRGAHADGVFMVLEGHVVLRNRIKTGRAFVPSIATVGQAFGSEGLSGNGKYVTDANASDEARTLFLSSSQFRAFVRERSGEALAFVSQMMSEHAHLLERLHELAALSVDERLAATLGVLSADSSLTDSSGRLKLENGHHRLLCEMVGATRESITLALSRLVSAGIAERAGTTFLIAPALLHATGPQAGNGETAVPLTRELARPTS